MTRKFLIVFGAISFCVMLSYWLIYASSQIGWDFLKNLLWKDLLSIMVTLLWLNLASMTFFMANLISLETKLNFSFDKTRKEVRDNLILMSACVTFYFLLGLFSPNSDTIHTSLYHLVKVLSVTLFLLQIFAVFELTIVLTNFKITNTKSDDKGK